MVWCWIWCCWGMAWLFVWNELEDHSRDTLLASLKGVCVSLSLCLALMFQHSLLLTDDAGTWVKRTLASFCLWLIDTIWGEHVCCAISWYICFLFSICQALILKQKVMDWYLLVKASECLYFVHLGLPSLMQHLNSWIPWTGPAPTSHLEFKDLQEKLLLELLQHFEIGVSSPNNSSVHQQLIDMCI